MQLMENEVGEVKSSYSRISNHAYLLTLGSPYTIYSEPVATGTSNLVLTSRSIHKSHNIVQHSASEKRKLVFQRPSFWNVEVHRFLVVDPWETYVI